jgi:UDPglucose 6-dehydrogenase
MRVAMIGTGYVGLVSGACFADFGHVVTCIDKDPTKIERLEPGEIPIFEPGLEDLVARNVREGRLFFTLDGAQAIKDADAVFIAGRHPDPPGDGHADLSYVYAAAEEIAGLIEDFTVVVTKSTVPVGTGDEVEAIIRRPIRTPSSPWSPIPSSCARARRSRISSVPTASWSAPRTSGPRR